MAKKTKGDPTMFADLTHDESWILAHKLASGAIAAGYRSDAHDHATCMEIMDVNADVQATWTMARQ